VGVNLYTWNRVSVFRINQLGGLSVNGARPITGHSAGQLTELNLPMSTIYVGGFPVSYHRQADTGMTSGFHGAIQRVCIATDMIDDMKWETQRGRPFEGLNTH